MNSYTDYLIKTYCVFEKYNKYKQYILSFYNNHNKNNNFININKWISYCNLVNYMLDIIPQEHKNTIKNVFLEKSNDNLINDFNINKRILEAVKVFWTYDQ